MRSQDNSEIADQELARRAQDSSLSSFEELVYRYEARLFRFLLKCSRSEDAAQELTQASLVTAFRSIHQYNPAQAFGPWLFTIARHKFIDYCRRQRLETDVIPEACDEEDPSVLLERTERHRGVWNWVKSLVSEDQFQALWLYYQEQMTAKEIARVLNRSVISVKVMLFRARRVLAKSLGAGGRESLMKTPAFALSKDHP